MSNAHPIAQSSAVIVLSSANACYVCSTAMVGISLLVSSLPQIIVCGVLATLVDLDVNRITLRNGIKKMVEQDYLLLRLTRQFLLSLAKQDIFDESEGATRIERKHSDFLAYYLDQYEHYQRLKGAPLRHAHPLFKARRELHALERYAATRLLNFAPPLNNDLTATLFNPEQIAAFAATFTHKQRLVRSTWIINLVAGCGTALITAYTAHTALLDIALLLSGTTLAIGPTVVIPIAIAAGAWYAITTFNNLHDIIVNESIEHKWLQIKTFLTSQDADHPWRLLAKKTAVVAGLIFILALGLFMTLATAGTWWYGVKQGAHLLPFLSQCARYLVSVVVPCVALAAFLFNFNNFLESAWKAQQLYVNKSFYGVINRCDEQWHQESWLERLNLFRLAKLLLESPIKIFIFIGHVLSVGAITDRMPKVPPEIPMLVGATCEAGEDFHFVMSKDPGIITYLVAIILSPLTVLDALWRYSFQSCQPLARRSLSAHFTQCLGIETETPTDGQVDRPKRQVSASFKRDWQQHQLREGLIELKARYTNPLSRTAQRKREALEAFLKVDGPPDEDRLTALRCSLQEKRFGLFATAGKTFGETCLDALLPTAA